MKTKLFTIIALLSLSIFIKAQDASWIHGDTLILPDSKTSLGMSEYQGLSSKIRVIVFGENFTSFGISCLQGGSFTTFVFKSTTPPTQGMSMEIADTIKCPCSAYDAYANSGWNSVESGWSWERRVLLRDLPYTLSTTENEQGYVEKEYPCDGTIIITPVSKYGYHFTQWSDGVTDNPRTVVMSKDTTFTALFAHNPVVTYVYNSQMGRITGPSMTSTGVAAENITFEAIPNYGYHFDKWKDGNTDNPRTIWLSQDTTMEVVFAKNTYTISTESANTELGTTSGGTSALYLDEIQISATPNYGYHFDHWEIEKYSESIEYKSIPPYVVKFSVPDTWTNPYAWVWETGYQGSWTTLSKENGMYVYRTAEDNRNIIIVPNGQEWENGQTNDLAITESCCYTIGEDDGWRYEVSKTYDCLSSDEQTIITWIDTIAHVDIVSTSVINPLTILVTSNQKAIAHFAKNVYGVTKQCSSEQGYITGVSQAEFLDYVTLTAVPNYGYHFTQWSDGLKDNPRIAQITCDTTFTAEFAYDRVGTCGKDLALVWSYDPTNKVLTIGNAGSFDENMQYGLEAPNEMTELVIGNSVTAIGESAFAGISTLKKVTIGESVKTIYNNAFYNCVNLETIYNYRPTPTNAYSTSFDGVDKFECALYVLSSSIDMYKNASVWRDFYYTYAIGAEDVTVTTDDVTIEPADNSAVVSWPVSASAATYTIQITKDGEIVCTLIFNANGQLTGIAFAPGKDGNRHAPAATLTANGMQFTVTGLNSSTHYALTLQAKDDQNAVVASYAGEFTTTGEAQVPTAIDQITNNKSQTTKIIKDNQLFILRGDKVYTITGQEVN